MEVLVVILFALLVIAIIIISLIRGIFSIGERLKLLKEIRGLLKDIGGSVKRSSALQEFEWRQKRVARDSSIIGLTCDCCGRTDSVLTKIDSGHLCPDCLGEFRKQSTDNNGSLTIEPTNQTAR